MHKKTLIVVLVGGVVALGISQLDWNKDVNNALDSESVGVGVTDTVPSQSVKFENVSHFEQQATVQEESSVKRSEKDVSEVANIADSTQLTGQGIQSDDSIFTAAAPSTLNDLLEQAIDGESGVIDPSVMAHATQLVVDEPDLLYEILERLSYSTDPQEKDLLNGLLLEATFAMDNTELVEGYLAEKAINSTGEAQSEWISLASEVGVRSGEARDKVLSIIPGLTNTKDLAAALNSVVPQLVSNQERQQVLTELSSYVYHEDPTVRGTAIAATAMWGDEEQASNVIQGLVDPEVEVRHSAATAALLSNIRTDEIKKSLLLLMNNKAEELSTRIQGP